MNKEPSHVAIDVPRPELGDLVPQFNNETTLYGWELVLQVAVDNEQVAAETWREPVYDSETPERYAIQQRVWRRGRGEANEDDQRAEELEEEERLAREQLGFARKKPRSGTTVGETSGTSSSERRT